MIPHVDICKGYHPWTAEFTDGTYLSRLGADVPFSAVVAKQALLYAFHIHLDWGYVIGVRITDGLFHKGRAPGDLTGWFKIKDKPSGVCTLLYSRRYEAKFNGPYHNTPELKCYTLGWAAEGTRAVLSVDPYINK